MANKVDLEVNLIFFSMIIFVILTILYIFALEGYLIIYFDYDYLRLFEY